VCAVSDYCRPDCFVAIVITGLRHCEKRGDEAIQGQGKTARAALDCFASLAMTAKSDPNLNSSGSLGQLLLDEGGDETRHGGGEIAEVTNQMDRGKFRLLLPGKIGLDPRLHRIAGQLRMQ
jgi:hypothetical protein